MRDEKFLSIKNGDYVRLLKPIEEGYIDLPMLSRGKVVYNRNQVEADIWFYNMGLEYGDNALRNRLEVKDTKIKGLVIKVEKKDFAVDFVYREHSKIQIDARKLIDMPFFKETEYLTRLPSNWYIGNERGIEYYINEVIDNIDEGFTKWVEKNIRTRKIFKYERDNFPEGWDRVLTDESYVKFEEKRKNLELKFAQVTGLYKEFTGGLLFE